MAAPFVAIGHSESNTHEYRELTIQEIAEDPFSDYFRISFTKRMDRDEAFALARKMECLVAEMTNTDTRVYLGVRNSRAERT